MPFSTRTLRLWLATLAVLIVAALTAYIAIGRMRFGNPLKGLTGKLGIDIEQESDNFTLSQSLRGRKVYTIHASKEIQHKNGLITLRSADITLYGREGDRNDRIHGDEFSYDQKNGVLHAIGPVFIDLAPPARAPEPGKPTTAAADETKLIHIRTSGLVFLQKEQNASTDEPVDFSAGGMNGHAVGASYDSGHGIVVLRSAVHITGIRADRPLVLTASRAELDRDGNLAILDQAHYLSAADSGPQSAAADHAIVRMDPDGTPRHIDADGHVALAGSGRGTVTGDHLQLDLTPAGQPREGHLFAHVAFLNQDPAHPDPKDVARGRADDAHVSFDPLGRPRHVLLTGAVDLDQRAGPSERRLDAATVDLTLTGGGKQPLVLVAGKALSSTAGGDRAWLHLLDANARVRDGEGTLTTDIRAQTLTGRFDPRAKKTLLQGLDGAGQTELLRVARDARGQTESDDTSRGDTLRLDFGPAPAPNPTGRLTLTRAEQHGSVESVHLAQRRAAPGKPQPLTPQPPERETTRADAEVYDALTDLATLTGSVELRDASSALYAQQARIDHRSGISTASGGVRVSYLDPNPKPGSPSEPVHVIAAQAVSTQSTGITTFTGSSAAKVRMWQGLSQVEAPELDLNRTRTTLYAHGSGVPPRPNDPPAVRTVLVDTGAKPASHPDAGNSGGPIRILSRELHYDDATREALFTGRVRVDNADGTMLSDDATAYLAPAGAPSPAQATAPALLGGGRLDHVIGTGHVTITQPERTGTGEKIVYTAADQTFVLTGTRSVLPRVTDDERGEVTGAILRFRANDKTVFVEGDATNQRVRTETKLK